MTTHRLRTPLKHLYLLLLKAVHHLLHLRVGLDQPAHPDETLAFLSRLLHPKESLLIDLAVFRRLLAGFQTRMPSAHRHLLVESD